MNASDSLVRVTWSFAALCSLAIVARSIIKRLSIQHIGADDIFIWAAFVCFIGQCASAQIQAQSGLGQEVQQVPQDVREQELKAEYANYLLYMPVIACAKLSVVSVLRKCALERRDRVLLYSFEWFLAAWAITAELVRAFGCHMPAPWVSSGNICVSKVGWVAFFETVNSLTELALIIIPTINIMSLPLPTKKRLIATSFFWTRIVIIPVSLLRIVYVNDISSKMVSNGPYVICTIVLAALEVLAACVLYAKPLFPILETGCFTLVYQHPMSRGSRSGPSSPNIGPYSKGSWPFTSISSVEDLLTLSGDSSYEAHVQAGGSDLEKEAQTEDIHVHRQVDILSSNAQRVDRAELYHPNAQSPSHQASMSSPKPWSDKVLPTTPPTLQNTTYYELDP